MEYVLTRERAEERAKVKAAEYRRTYHVCPLHTQRLGCNWAVVTDHEYLISPNCLPEVCRFYPDGRKVAA